MKILVTGATGYIGSHVCKILYERDHQVHGLDINFKQNYITEYCDRIFVKDILKYTPDEDYDVVIHLAGLISVEESVKNPSSYYNTNLNGTLRVLDKFPNAHIIFASTAGAFDPQSPYARSKIAAEDVIKEKAHSYTIFRFFNVAGSDGVNMQQGTSTHLIRIAAECAVGKREKMYIYGDDYETRDGTCVRDYIHVVDLANAICSAAEHGPANTPYECIGSGQGYTVKEVLDTMNTLYKVNYEVAPRRSGDPAILAIDNQYSGLKIEHSLLDMCASAVEVEKLRKETDI